MKDRFIQVRIVGNQLIKKMTLTVFNHRQNNMLHTSGMLVTFVE